MNLDLFGITITMSHEASSDMQTMLKNSQQQFFEEFKKSISLNCKLISFELFL